MSFFYGPDKVVNEILNTIKLRKICTSDGDFIKCLCSNVDENPEITFILDGHHYAFSSDDYQKKNDDGTCTVLIVPIDENY